MHRALGQSLPLRRLNGDQPVTAQPNSAKISCQQELVDRVKAYDSNADETALNEAYVFSMSSETCCIDYEVLDARLTKSTSTQLLHTCKSLI